MKEIAWSGQNKIFKVSGSSSRGRPRNTWNEVTGKNESHQGLSQRHKCLKVILKKPSNTYNHRKLELKRMLMMMKDFEKMISGK